MSANDIHKFFGSLSIVDHLEVLVDVYRNSNEDMKLHDPSRLIPSSSDKLKSFLLSTCPERVDVYLPFATSHGASLATERSDEAMEYPDFQMANGTNEKRKGTLDKDRIEISIVSSSLTISWMRALGTRIYNKEKSIAENVNTMLRCGVPCHLLFYSIPDLRAAWGESPAMDVILKELVTVLDVNESSSVVYQAYDRVHAAVTVSHLEYSPAIAAYTPFMWNSGIDVADELIFMCVACGITYRSIKRIISTFFNPPLPPAHHQPLHAYLYSISPLMVAIMKSTYIQGPTVHKFITTHPSK